MTSNNNALLLGKLYSSHNEKPAKGQPFRDQIRCQAMKKLDYKVFTLDDKHDEINGMNGKHCRANFADHTRMKDK